MNAFIQHPLPVRPSTQNSNRSSCPRQTPVAQRVRAPAVDSRVSGATASHHWIHVTTQYARAFERAAAANASVTAEVERRAGGGASRRWVLRRVADPTLGFLDGTFAQDTATYVVMERYLSPSNPTTTPSATADTAPTTRRWLSAVRRVGPALGALDIASRDYDSIFAAERYRRDVDAERCYVVVEAVQALPSHGEAVRHVLSTGAEAAVMADECVEMDVLQATTNADFFKIVTVYEDVDQMVRHLEGGYNAFRLRTRGKLIDAKRERQTFKPTLLA